MDRYSWRRWLHRISTRFNVWTSKLQYVPTPDGGLRHISNEWQSLSAEDVQDITSERW